MTAYRAFETRTFDLFNEMYIAVQHQAYISIAARFDTARTVQRPDEIPLGELAHTYPAASHQCVCLLHRDRDLGNVITTERSFSKSSKLSENPSCCL